MHELMENHVAQRTSKVIDTQSNRCFRAGDFSQIAGIIPIVDLSGLVSFQSPIVGVRAQQNDLCRYSCIWIAVVVLEPAQFTTACITGLAGSNLVPLSQWLWKV